MTGLVSAHDVARELTRLLPDTLWELQKHRLLYLCQGLHLALFGQPLFTERIEAWGMGPVVADLWREEKKQLTRRPQELDDTQLNTVACIVSRYGRLSGRELMNITHDHEPWKVAHAKPRGAQLMQHDAIRDTFIAAAEERDREIGRVRRDPEELREWLAAHPAPKQAEPDDVAAMRAFFGCETGAS